jgi:tRNA (cmo5U34)-methyltransferase
VAFDDLKESGGKVYSGMSIGDGHRWLYPDGIWEERKVAPDRWDFTFSSLKTRTRSAPEGSGAAIGTSYHWYILAHQRVRKRDKDSYDTFMEGMKFKVAHRRPHWRSWSTEYPDQEPEREVLIRILEEELARLRKGDLPHSRHGEQVPGRVARPSSRVSGTGRREESFSAFPSYRMEADNGRRAPMNGLKESFDAIASGYDAQRRWIIPDFEWFSTAAVRAAGDKGDAPSILDIGAGTGLLSARFLEVYPSATLTLMDVSEKMLGVAERRFAGRERTRFITADYRDGDLGGPFDIICSALSIHHLGSSEKRDLYQRIFGALGKGGHFVNADEVAGESEEIHRGNLAAWDAFLLSGPLGKEEAMAIMERREQLDRMEKLSVQLGWMKEIGFRDVGAVYRNGCFAVFTGRKGNP